MRMLALFFFGLVAVASGPSASAQPVFSSPAMEVPRNRTLPRSLHLAARIDGVDRLVITRASATWHHHAWKMPESVAIGDRLWDVGAAPVRANAGGSAFLAADVDLASARLRLLKGRDLVTLEASDEQVTVWFCDSPGGADLYELELQFDSLGRAFELTVNANIDGRDELLLFPERAVWIHRLWSEPDRVSLNGSPWDVRTQMVRSNDGATRFVPADVDWSTARVVQRQGRGLVSMERRDETLRVVFSDPDPGADDYRLVIRFGAEPLKSFEPSSHRRPVRSEAVRVTDDVPQVEGRERVRRSGVR